MPIVRVSPADLDLEALAADMRRREASRPEPTEEQLEQWRAEDEAEASAPLPPDGDEVVVPYRGPFLKRRPAAE